MNTSTRSILAFSIIFLALISMVPAAIPAEACSQRGVVRGAFYQDWKRVTNSVEVPAYVSARRWNGDVEVAGSNVVHGRWSLSLPPGRYEVNFYYFEQDLSLSVLVRPGRLTMIVVDFEAEGVRWWASSRMVKEA